MQTITHFFILFDLYTKISAAPLWQPRYQFKPRGFPSPLCGGFDFIWMFILSILLQTSLLKLFYEFFY